MKMPLSAVLLFACSNFAWAGKADVVAVAVTNSAEGVYRFEVTIKSDETGWDKYADKWDVVAPDGTVLGTRVLAHPHVDEQPFTRSLDGVAIPAGLSTVTIRAHDKVEGYGGQEMTITLPPPQ
jgi:hypothetical protein